MKAGEAMAMFDKGMREERKALTTMETYRSHVRQFLASRVGSPLDAEETNILPLRRTA